VHENIIPGIAPDESVAFFIVKPFNHALFFHFSSLFFTSKTCAARRDTDYSNCLFSFHSKPRGDETKRADFSAFRLSRPFTLRHVA
jgi:hypothetical protein